MSKSKRFAPNPIVKNIIDSGSSEGIVEVSGFIGGTADGIVDVYTSLNLDICLQIPERAINDVIDGDSNDQPSKLFVTKGTKIKEVRERIIDSAKKCSCESQPNYPNGPIGLRRASLSSVIPRKKSVLLYDPDVGGYIIVEVDDVIGPPDIPDFPFRPGIPFLCKDLCARKHDIESDDYQECVDTCRAGGRF